MLTPKQQEVYDFLIDFFGENQRFPTFREIAARFSLPHGAVQARMDALKTKGFISADPNRAGTLKLTGYRAILQKEQPCERD